VSRAELQREARFSIRGLAAARPAKREMMTVENCILIDDVDFGLKDSVVC
jgi:hypothetical protein